MSNLNDGTDTPDGADMSDETTTDLSTDIADPAAAEVGDPHEEAAPTTEAEGHNH